MKKEYNYYVNKRNTPHLELYTKLIGLFFFYLGVNLAIGFIYYAIIGERRLSGCLIGLSMLMFSLISTKTKDPRRENRGIVAVVFAGIAHILITIPLIFILEDWRLIIICLYLFEILIVIIIACRYFRSIRSNDNKEKTGR